MVPRRYHEANMIFSKADVTDYAPVFIRVYEWRYSKHHRPALIAKFMGPTWGPSGADRTQVGPMLAPWTLLSGNLLFVTDCQNNKIFHYSDITWAYSRLKSPATRVLLQANNKGNTIIKSWSWEFIKVDKVCHWGPRNCNCKILIMVYMFHIINCNFITYCLDTLTKLASIQFGNVAIPCTPSFM